MKECATITVKRSRAVACHNRVYGDEVYCEECWDRKTFTDRADYVNLDYLLEDNR